MKRLSAIALTMEEAEKVEEQLSFEGYKDIVISPHYDYEAQLKWSSDRLLWINIFYTETIQVLLDTVEKATYDAELDDPVKV